MTPPTAESGAARWSAAWLWIMVLATVLTQTGLNVFRPVTSYKLIDLGASASLIGVVTAAYALVPLLIALPLGRFVDRTFRLRSIMGAGAALLAAGGALLALTDSIAFVVVANVILGLGHLLFTIAGQASIARFAPPEDHDRGFGYFTAGFSVGQLIGPLLAGAVLGQRAGAEQISLALWLGAASAGLAVVLLLVRSAVAGTAQARGREAGGSAAQATEAAEAAEGAAPAPEGAAAEGEGAAPAPEGAAAEDEGAAAERETPASGRPTALGVLRRRGVRSQIFASLSLLVIIDILTAYLPLVGEHAGIAPATVGLLLAVRGLASIASRIMIGPLTRRFDRARLVTASALVAGATLALPPLLLDHLWLAVVLMVVGGFFLGLGQPLTMSLITQSVPTTWRGTALATRLVGNRMGQVAFPALAGVLAVPLGPGGPIWFACATLVASGTEMLVRLRRRPGEDSRGQ